MPRLALDSIYFCTYRIHTFNILYLSFRGQQMLTIRLRRLASFHSDTPGFIALDYDQIRSFAASCVHSSYR
jgi:hypothetical protein